MGVAQIKQEGLRRFWSKFPLTRVPFWYWLFELIWHLKSLQEFGCRSTNYTPKVWPKEAWPQSTRRMPWRATEGRNRSLGFHWVSQSQPRVLGEATGRIDLDPVDIQTATISEAWQEPQCRYLSVLVWFLPSVKPFSLKIGRYHKWAPACHLLPKPVTQFQGNWQTLPRILQMFSEEVGGTGLWASREQVWLAFRLFFWRTPFKVPSPGENPVSTYLLHNLPKNGAFLGLEGQPLCFSSTGTVGVGQ